MSTISSLSDDDSPVFHRRQKITFVGVETVASSSVRYECDSNLAGVSHVFCYVDQNSCRHVSLRDNIVHLSDLFVSKPQQNDSFCRSVCHQNSQTSDFIFPMCFHSLSKSPLQDIMNTPKFQMRKMQRQIIKERDYRDGLERELASKLTLIAQKGVTFKSFGYQQSLLG